MLVLLSVYIGCIDLYVSASMEGTYTNGVCKRRGAGTVSTRF